ncbi:unnamed protein product [Candidula unifasciata]|uniref:NEDD1 n=1 Tax=Candidula unifasciata TaxID=100452 RepID=A0A8S4A966_9EUPU|nr:unnamed protein product [Candidula unifasciata]
MTFLASSGAEAKIWDVPTFSLLEQFNPFTSSISDLTWSHDGNSIAACCSSEKTVHLRLTKTSQSVPSESIVLPAGCQCLDYNSSSRFILCGCVDGSVHIWDRKSKVIKKSYGNLKHPVTVARWNWNDTYISVGLENGNIVLYNVATSQASSPLVAPNVNTIRQLKYNPYQKSSLVSVSDDSAVNFWDANTRRLVHAFTETHQAPARDLAFSPINDFLMVSVGLDKRAVFYDVQNKKPVNTIVAEHPLTCVDIMQDGATVVVGTTRGRILFYDMRQPTSPVFSFTAHKSSVKHLSFVRKDGDKGDSLSSLSIRRQLPTTPVTAVDASGQNLNNSNYQSPRNNTYSTGMDIFSPISHGDGVYSPVRHDNSHSINSTYNRSSVLSNNSFLTQVLGSVDNVHKDVGNNHSSSLYTIGEITEGKTIPTAVDAASSLPEKETSQSPPKLQPPRGIGASPSLQQLSSKIENGGDSTPGMHRTSPEKKLRTSPGSVAMSPTAGPLSRPGIPSADRPEILSTNSVNGSASGGHVFRLIIISDMHVSYVDAITCAFSVSGPTSSSPLRSPNSLHHNRPSSDPAPTTTLAAASTVRLLVQDLLKEQFQQHQEQLKMEIRAMLGHPTASQASSSASLSLPNQSNPGMFQAEFIRNLIREELDDMKDFIHKEFWCIQVEMIKQIFQLQKRMEAGFQECMINPVLLDEIDRLREENARLRKTF